MTPLQKPKKIVFVCTGNICRSALAEHMLNKMSADRGMGLTAKSCGCGAQTYYQMPVEITALLASEGVTGVDHVPQLLNRRLLGWSDLCLTMTRAHRDHVLDLFPEFTAKIHILRPYCGLAGPDVEDPMGGSKEVYAACLDSIRQALEVLVKDYEH